SPSGALSTGWACDHELVLPRHRAPDFAVAPQQLGPVRIRRGMTAYDERLRGRIESNERVAAPLGHPDHVGIVDVHGVRHRAIARQLPLLPGVAVVAGELTRIPLAHPDAAFGVAPDAPRALAWGGWDEDGRDAGLRSEEHTSEPSHVKSSYAVFCLK